MAKRKITWEKKFLVVVDGDKEIIEFQSATKRNFGGYHKAMELCKKENLHPVTNKLRHSFVLADNGGNVRHIIFMLDIEEESA